MLSAAVLSCGQRTPTEPDPAARIVAIPASDIFANSPQLEPRELLIDGRATDIEWQVTGDPVLLLLRGSTGSGGDYYASVRAYWTYSPYNADSIALYLLVQWADRRPDVLEQPLVTSVDWQDADNQSLVDCNTSDPLHDEANWRKDTSRQEDQIEVEIYSDASGALPADKWRWGAATTDPVTPVSPTEYLGADAAETFGANVHPSAGWSEDYYDAGAGWVLDAGDVTHTNNFAPGSNIPLFITGRGGRDTRMNRGKPPALLIWRYVSRPLLACDSLNPIRIEDASARQKTWNPEDYVQSYRSQMPSFSQADVVTRAAWEDGKWAVEMRRLMEPREADVGGQRGALHFDDVQFHTGRTYGFRLRIYDASKTQSSVSPMVPLYIQPRD